MSTYCSCGVESAEGHCPKHGHVRALSNCTCDVVYPFAEEQGCPVHPKKPPFPPVNREPLLPPGTKLSCDLPNPFPGNRKEYPIFTGLLMYFPDACAAVARCSYIANEQHNPGEPVHWDKSKSVGEGNELLRHLMQGGSLDSDGIAHDVKAAWRALELVQRRIEAERG